MNRLVQVAAALLACLPLQNAIAADFAAEVRFGDLEISVIRDYYGGLRGDDRKSLGNNRSLPPGIAKNLARGKSLPPGIARQALPTALSSRLPPAPKGFERIVVDGKILLVEIATQVIHDVLTDIVND